MGHIEHQRKQFNDAYSSGSRQHVISDNQAIKYIVTWRVQESIMRLMAASNGYIDKDSSILTLCSGEGMEGSILSDLGFTNVTVSDLSENGVDAALKRDSRLKGVVLDAQDSGLNSESFDIVLVQDGLHHLPSPVQGFTEMLRLAKKGCVFLEPHESLVGRLIGTEWEKNGQAINYVFRWNKNLVDQIAKSYLGGPDYLNLSFSFWHHNPMYAKIPKLFGASIGLHVVKLVKLILDITLGRFGNQFSAVILKHRITSTK
jgi:ubiquinone/menaquinone biosynthesis C-methylase UbiE